MRGISRSDESFSRAATVRRPAWSARTVSGGPRAGSRKLVMTSPDGEHVLKPARQRPGHLEGDGRQRKMVERQIVVRLSIPADEQTRTSMMPAISPLGELTTRLHSITHENDFSSPSKMRSIFSPAE